MTKKIHKIPLISYLAINALAFSWVFVLSGNKCKKIYEKITNNITMYFAFNNIKFSLCYV